MNDFLTIAVSTNTKDLFSLKESLSLYLSELDDKVSFLVVYQGDAEIENMESKRLRFLYNSKKGLSSNRNLSIKYSQSKWLWFQDDDIILDVDNVNKLVKILEKNTQDLCFINVGSLENKSEYYKNYNYEDTVSFLIPFKISSIEIIANINFLNESNIAFDENIGLGTSLPSGEENVFILNCINAEADYAFLNLKTCYHTTLEHKRQMKTREYFLSKGYILSKVNLFVALLLSIRWASRETRTTGFLNTLRYFKDGYIMGLKLSKEKRP